MLADSHGTILHLGERECSLQRRHQKVIEESPSPVVDAALRARLGDEAVALARDCGYVGAGTVEFIAEADAPEHHYFLEMNTRLQVEHAVTEAVYGVDLVEWQLRVAAGERLELDLGPPQGHAVEARIYAEDPARGFLPASGRLLGLSLPSGEGVRVDVGVAAGGLVTTRYDPMIAKVTVHEPTRLQALARLHAELAGTELLGLHTNVGFLCDLLLDADVLAGRVDTGFLERTRVGTAESGGARAALIALIAETYANISAAPRDPFVLLDGWRIGEMGAPVRRRALIDGEREVELTLGPLALQPTTATIDEEAVEVDSRGLRTRGWGGTAARRTRWGHGALVGGRRRRAVVGRQRRAHLVGRPERAHERRSRRYERGAASADAGVGRRSQCGRGSGRGTR